MPSTKVYNMAGEAVDRASKLSEQGVRIYSYVPVLPPGLSGHNW